MTHKLHILVVDDDRRMAQTTTDILNIKGYRAQVAYSGSEALDKITRERFDCVLTDIRMPGMNGLELHRAIKGIHPNLPVVLMTAYAGDSMVQKGLDDGAIAALSKPLDLTLLLSFFSSMRKERTICIVDDDPNFCKSLRDILVERNYPVITIPDPQDIPDDLGSNGQMVLLDMNLGRLNGLDILKKIRSQHPNVPVILVTGYRSEMAPAIERAIQINAFTCLYKPLQIEELLGTIHQAYRQELRRRLGGPNIKRI